MKRIINYLVIIFILFMFIPSVNAKGVTIDSVEVDSKSNGAKILEDATVEDLSISFNVNFVEKNDFIKYKIVINNSTDENYIISESKNSSDYIEYIYEYDNKIIEKKQKEYYVRHY